MSRDIKLLHPEVQAIIPKFLEECKKQGLIVKTTDTLRTEEEQNKLYAQGRTTQGKIVTWVKYPYSNHNWGMAFDICRNDGKGAYYDADGFFTKVGQIGKKYGLTWGGDWRDSPDKPHFELTKYGSTTTLARKYGTPNNFKKTWGKVEGGKKYMHINSNYTYNNKVKNLDVINENGVNYVKVRDLADLLNKEIKYDNATKITTLEDKYVKVNIVANDKDYSVEAINSNGNNFVKLRDIAEVLNHDVLFNEKTKQIMVNIKKSVFNLFKK